MLATKLECTVADDTVCVSFPDGSQADVHLELIAKSKALQDTVSAAENEQVFTPGTPPELLQAWLQCATMLTGPFPDLGLLPTDELVQCLLVRLKTYHSACVSDMRRQSKIDGVELVIIFRFMLVLRIQLLHCLR